jgi:hypothetical protein
MLEFIKTGGSFHVMRDGSPIVGGDRNGDQTSLTLVRFEGFWTAGYGRGQDRYEARRGTLAQLKAWTQARFASEYEDACVAAYVSEGLGEY